VKLFTPNGDAIISPDDDDAVSPQLSFLGLSTFPNWITDFELEQGLMRRSMPWAEALKLYDQERS
jgi:hypothetical protein